jgi:hypothetical protein
VVWWVLGVVYVLVVGAFVWSACVVAGRADEWAEREWLRREGMKKRAVPPDESAG